MQRQYCRGCGREIDRDATRCPYCGARSDAVIPRFWVLAFFVTGIAIGLVLLILQGSLTLSWPTMKSMTSPEKVVMPPSSPANRSAARTREATVSPGRPQQQSAYVPATVEPFYCDRDAAMAVRNKARRLAVISEQGGVLQLQLGDDWAYYSLGLRRSFVEVFSRADRCLQGQARAIRLTFRGEEVATVTTAGVVEMK